VYCRVAQDFARHHWYQIHPGSKVAILLIACLAGFACNRQAARPQADRIAILRFENLGSDGANDWMGRAFSEIITTELAASPNGDPISSNRMHTFNQTFGARPISVPGISAERLLALASGATRIGYGSYVVRGGRLDAQLTVEDQRTGKMMEILSSSSSAADPMSAASGLARQISTQTGTYGTRSVAALKAWMTALESSDAAVTGQSLEQAIAADPDFGPPYRLLAQWKTQRQDRAGAVALLEQALSRGNRIPPAERARIELEMANLRDDAAGRQQSLAQLVKLEPRDATARRALAETA